MKKTQPTYILEVIYGIEVLTYQQNNDTTKINFIYHTQTLPCSTGKSPKFMNPAIKTKHTAVSSDWPRLGPTGGNVQTAVC